MDIEKCAADDLVDQMLAEYDETIMPLPEIELEPHILISKVRKHYMEYMIKLLSLNYETNQKLLNKNIYLPSAIWRCAKNIEMTAAQACMVVQIYRKNITPVIKELKNDTKKGKLYNKLYECLNKPPVNEKKVQTVANNVAGSNCQCSTIKRKRRTRTSLSPSMSQYVNNTVAVTNESINITHEQYKIPVAINLHTEPAQPVTPKEIPLKTVQLPSATPQMLNISKNPSPNTRISVESQDSDELMLQLEKLFQGDIIDDDTLFEKVLCDTDNSNDNIKKLNDVLENKNPNTIIEDHAAQIKHLDERLATLAGMFVESNVPQPKTENHKSRKHTSKWLCEEYFLKQQLYEFLDQIRDSNRKDLEKIKYKFTLLFGYDSDYEDIISPLDETPEFITSCKERIAPWVVKLLTPHYIKGRIRGKSLFKSLAKHLIRLIYQCSRYPQEYEVTSFVSDFLANHQMIRCEADFKEFKIDNI